MGLLDWSPTPARNNVADKAIPAQDGASAREFPGLVRGVMANVRRYADARGGALRTGGSLNAYTVDAGLGVTEIRPGIDLIVRADRTNTAQATLNVDGLGPLPWVDAGGLRLLAGRIIGGRFYHVILDAEAGAWQVQAGASTLEEIPGFVDGVAQVAANTTQVAADRAVTSAAAAQSAADRAIVVAKAAQVDGQYQQIAGAVALIDGLDTRLTAEITRSTQADAAEIQARIAGLQNEADLRAAADATERDARIAADQAETNARLVVEAALRRADGLLAESMAAAQDAAAADLADTARALQDDTAARDDDAMAATLRRAVLDSLRAQPTQYAYLGSMDGLTDEAKVLSLPSGRRVLQIYPIMGQSLAEDSTSGPTLWNTIGLPYPSRALMPDTALHPEYAATAMVSLVEQQSLNRPYESLASGFANHLLRDIDALLPGTNCQIGTFITALGGRCYSALKKGSPNWQRFTGTLEGIVRWALAQGYDEVVVPGILWVQGEAEVFGPGRDRYRAMLWQLQRDLQAAIQRITGQTEPVILFLSQTAVAESYSAPRSGLRLQQEQMEACAEHPYLRMVGPTYAFPRSPDKIHLTGAGANYHGQMFARVVLAEIYGAGWRPLTALDAHLVPHDDGTLRRIRIPMFVPVEPLVLDSSGATIKLGTMASKLGFDAYDLSGTPLAIEAVSVFRAVSDNDWRPTLDVDLAAVSSVPKVRLNYASRRDLVRSDGSAVDYDDGPIYGIRGCVRDSADHANLYDGSLHRNWMPSWTRIVACNPAPAGASF